MSLAGHLPPAFDNASIITVSRTLWDIRFHPAFETWTNSLAQQDGEALLAALRILRGWYQRNIPIADDRFDEHQSRLIKETEAATKQLKAQKKGRTKK